MQIIKAGYDIMDPLNGEEILKKIEQVARVCYKSEDKIGEGTAEKMVRALIKSNHLAMLEHASLVIGVTGLIYDMLKRIVADLEETAGFVSFLRFTDISNCIISGNLRAWREFIIVARGASFSLPNDLVKILTSEKYRVFFEDLDLRSYESKGSVIEIDPYTLDTAEKLIHADLTVKFIVDRGVSHEIVRHRVASFAQESTRYCNYGNKGGEITVIEPFYLMADGVKVSTENWSERYGAWVSACAEAEKSYLRMIADGATPQEARAVLPTSLKTEVVMTANLKEWRHFFSLRACGSTGKPHPQMLEVAVPLLNDIKELIPVVFTDLEPMEL